MNRVKLHLTSSATRVELRVNAHNDGVATHQLSLAVNIVCLITQSWEIIKSTKGWQMQRYNTELYVCLICPHDLQSSFNYKFCHYLHKLMLFQTYMIIFLPWKPKVDRVIGFMGFIPWLSEGNSETNLPILPINGQVKSPLFI